jgi:hypothetical protein
MRNDISDGSKHPAEPRARMAIDEELRHRARRREHVCSSISRFCIRDIKEIVGAEWNLLNLASCPSRK